MPIKKSKVKFVINKKIDIRNHFIGINSYKTKLHSFHQKNKNERYEKLLKLSRPKAEKAISEEIAWFYSIKNKKEREKSLKQIQTHWNKVEKKYFKKLEEVHEASFDYPQIKGVLSTAGRFGYYYGKNPWFATSFKLGPKRASYIAMHELMHFIFHKHFWNFCEKRGLSWKQIWDIKESMTILLNIEFSSILFEEKDCGYPEHKKIRTFIKKTWPKRDNFKDFLTKTCDFTKKIVK